VTFFVSLRHLRSMPSGGDDDLVASARASALEDVLKWCLVTAALLLLAWAVDRQMCRADFEGLLDC